MTNRHPSVNAVTRFFEYDHLPEPLKTISKLCADLKDDILDKLEDDPELTVGLRHLLDAKDCFVRTTVAQVNRNKGNATEGAPL